MKLLSAASTEISSASMEPQSKAHKTNVESEEEEEEDQISGESSTDDSDYSLEDLEADEDIEMKFVPKTEASSDTSFEISSQETISQEEEKLNDPDDLMSCLPEQLFINIMQKLRVSDLKSAFGVCKHWSRLLSRSDKILGKLLLKIELKGENGDVDNLLSLHKSRRAYQNVEICVENNKEIERKMDAILMRFASSIINLRIVKVGGFNSMMQKPLSLIKLQSFELHVVCGRLSCDLQNVCTLKKLTVDGLNPKELVLCLKQNAGLEKLTFYDNAFISYFTELAKQFDDPTELSFKLNSLAVLDHINSKDFLYGEFPAAQWNAKERIFFMKFLRSQSSSLKSLHLDKCFVEDFNNIFNVLPGLECLEVNELIGDGSNLKFQEISTVKTFVASRISDDLLIAVAYNFVNLKSIFIENLKTHQFFFIIRNAQSLRLFCYFYASASEKKHGSFIDLRRLYRRADVYRSSLPDIDIQLKKKETFMKMIETQNIL